MLLELGAEFGELQAAVVDRLHEGEVLLVEQSIAVHFVRLVVLHADGSEGSELAAVYEIRVQHQDVLGDADKCNLHLVRVRLDLFGFVGQSRETQIESGHGQAAERANLPVGDRLQRFVDCLLFGEALERFGRLVVGRLRAEINQVVKGEISEVGLRVGRRANGRQNRRPSASVSIGEVMPKFVVRG